MSLKTKGFTRKSEALKFVGGGENRTLVLGNFCNNLYMLIVFGFAIASNVRRAIKEAIRPFKSRMSFSKGRKGKHSH